MNFRNFQLIRTLFILLFITIQANAQSISGSFPNLSNQYIKLTGFNGFDTYAIDSVKVNEKGEFQLSFGKEDYGMAYLLSEDDKSFVVILSEESVTLKGESLAIPESVEIVEGKQNKLLSNTPLNIHEGNKH